MKILVLADYFGVGGGAGRIAQIAAEGLAKDHEVQVLAAHAKEPVTGQASKYKVFTYDLDYPPFWRNCLGLYHGKALWALKERLEKFRPEVCFIHVLHSNWSYAVLKVLQEAKVKSILTFHDVAAFTPYVKLCGVRPGEYHYSFLRHLRDAKLTYIPWRNAVIRKYLRYATKTVAVSEELKLALEQNRIRIDAVIHNGINLASNAPLPLFNLRGRGEEVIFYGGRLSSSKGALQAVRYLKILKDKFALTPELRIAGEEGRIGEKMLGLAKALGVADQLNFLGWLEKFAYEKNLNESSVVIVPSICFDSFPTVILEAMKLGKPVVATNLGGAKELVENGHTGYIENPFDREKFASRIAEMFLDREKARQMGEAGLKRLKENFTAERMIKDYLDML